MRNDVLDTPSSLDDFALGNASCPGSRRVASSSEESCSTTYCLLDCPVWGVGFVVVLVVWRVLLLFVIHKNFVTASISEDLIWTHSFKAKSSAAPGLLV